MRARPPARQPRSTTLRAIDGGRCSTSTPDEVRITRGAGRNERNEPWTLPAGPGLQALEDAAAEVGLDLDLAIRLAVEHALATVDLDRLDVLTEPLDDHARAVAVNRALEGQHAAYLRRLHPRAPRPARDVAHPITAGLPTRLSTRLLAGDLEELVDAADLPAALDWETAALLEGRTISEWAPLTALALR